MAIHLQGSITDFTTVIYRSQEDSSQLSLEKNVQSVYKKFLERDYLNTYKAVHLGGKTTQESRMIRSAATIFPTHSEEETKKRLSNYTAVAPNLNTLTTAELSTLLTKGERLGSGTGGEFFSLEVQGVRVFAKKIRLTAIEQQNPRATHNLFNLPTYYQYGVGSLGFGVWREIATHEMTTQWVLNGECQNFPLMYHYRVLERAVGTRVEEIEDREEYIKYWDGSQAVGVRAKLCAEATADVVVFMEHIPETLYKWIKTEGLKGGLTSTSLTRLEKELLAVAAFIKSHGFLHFDAHFGNILTDNKHVYFADFGLAMSKRFDLSFEERAFFDKHQDYDRYHVIMELAHRAIEAVAGDKANEVVEAYYSTKQMTIALPRAVASIAERYRPIAHRMHEFLQNLSETSKTTPYPKAEFEREWTILHP